MSNGQHDGPNLYSSGVWQNGQWYPYKSQSDMAITQNQMAKRQQQASGYEPSDNLDELPAPPRKEIPPADFELLVLAARALNADFEEVDGEGYGNLHFPDGSVVNAWNPLQFSGDALELAVRLRLELYIHEQDTRAVAGNLESAQEGHGDDPLAATRRAVTRAAAEIVRAKRFLNEIS